MKTTFARTLLVGTLLACSTFAFAQVKVGFVGTLSGPAGDTGRDQIDGFSLALE